jgi:maleylacetate reductase
VHCTRRESYLNFSIAKPATPSISVKPFVYNALPGRVIFGTGTLQNLAAELEQLNCRRAFVLCGAQQASKGAALMAQLGPLAVGLFCEAAMHTPVKITDRAMSQLREAKSDCLVALGGGSTIGLGKALAQRTDLPQIAVPTTYAGSEATPILGQTELGRKTIQRTLKVLPKVIIYDVALTLTLPPRQTVASGMNAIAHAVEALYANDVSPMIEAIAQQGITAFAQALPSIVQDPRNQAARAIALYGAWTCGVCLGTGRMALHHQLCHMLGGSFHLPHAETHAVMLAHAVAYNALAAPDAMVQIAHALGVENAAQGLYNLAQKIGAPMTLREIGMQAGDLPRAAELAVAAPYWNPRPIDKAAALALLSDAFYGRRPS